MRSSVYFIAEPLDIEVKIMKQVCDLIHLAKLLPSKILNSKTLMLIQSVIVNKIYEQTKEFIDYNCVTKKHINKLDDSPEQRNEIKL